MCGPCTLVWPLRDGIWILLTYSTSICRATIKQWSGGLREETDAGQRSLPQESSPTGEEFVAATSSKEWSEEKYSSKLWRATTEDRVRTFMGECGVSPGGLSSQWFYELGCGPGIMTNQAGEVLGAEAWGSTVETRSSARRTSSGPRAAYTLCKPPCSHPHSSPAAGNSRPFSGDFIIRGTSMRP